MSECERMKKPNGSQECENGTELDTIFATCIAVYFFVIELRVKDKRFSFGVALYVRMFMCVCANLQAFVVVRFECFVRLLTFCLCLWIRADYP